MKKVEFVKVRSELSGYGFGKGTRYSFDGVEDTIRRYIENGWDYCGYVPTPECMKEGVYEARLATSSCLEPAAGDKIADALIEMHHKMN